MQMPLKSLVNMLLILAHIQEAIQQHKSDLTGVPEALRSEAQQLRDELSQMELFSRLGELKEQLAEASESAPREANADGTNTEATTALVCEAEDTELDIQLQQLFQAVEVRPKDSLLGHSDHMGLTGTLSSLCRWQSKAGWTWKRKKCVCRRRCWSCSSC